MEYTSGEWEIKIDKELACITIVSDKGYKIATIHPFGAYREMPNANLIAAAPNSHEANKVALSLIDALIKQRADLASDYRVQMVKSTLEQAIAKVEGGK